MNTKNIISKACLLLMGLLFSRQVTAQDPCTITCSATLPVCSGAPVTLSVERNDQYTYTWFANGQITGLNAYRITVYPLQETSYRVEIRDLDDEHLICESESFTVTVKPRFTTSFTQLMLTCSNREEDNGRTAQVLAYVNKEQSETYDRPYTYKWRVSPLHVAPGCDSLAIGLEAYKYYFIEVTDGRGCTQTDSVWTKAYPNPRVEIHTDPGDTVYLQNPHVTYSFENLSADTIGISNFYWILNQQYNLTSTQDEPRFTYVEAGDFTTQLKVYNPQGCDTTYMKNIRVEKVKLKIPSVFTPNGDGINDYFIISVDNASDGGGGSDTGGSTRASYDEPSGGHEYDDYEPLNRYYESAKLVVFNRWGNIVYSSNDYHNDWDGGDLSDGTYFYVLKCHGLKEDTNYQGSVMIFRGRK